MTRFGKLTKATTLAVAIAAGFGASTSAQAGALATSILDVSQFSINFTSTGLEVPISTFGGALITDSGKNVASLNGFPTQTVTGTQNGGGTFDLAAACVGVVCPAANTFTHSAPGSISPNQYAWADSLVTGAPVTGLITNPGDPKARAVTGSEVKLTGTGTGGGLSNLSLLTTFAFTTTAAVSFTFDFLANLYERAFLGANSNIGFSSADAGAHLTFKIQQVSGAGTLATIFNWAPNGQSGGIFGGNELFDEFDLQQNTAVTLPGFDSIVDSLGNKHFAASVNLGTGNYIFSVDHGVVANAALQIPEPGSLALAGVALLALVGSRRNKKAA